MGNENILREEVRNLKDRLKDEITKELYDKKVIKRLMISDLVILSILIIVGVFTYNFYDKLQEYESNLLYMTSEIDKIHLFRDEMVSNEILIKSIQDSLRFQDEVYFYFEYNDSKKDILEVYSYKISRHGQLVENKYLFDLEVG